MKCPRRTLVTLALALAASAMVGQGLHANCQDNSPYEVRQCARGSWFSAPPAGSGSISATWWAIGFGNRGLVAPISATQSAPNGSGFFPVPLPGVFFGIDSGPLSTYGLDLVDATTITGLGAPPGATCLSSASNWGAPGVDDCIEVNRNAYTGGGAADFSDDYLNRYFNSAYGPYEGYLTLENQLDPPMAVLLTESTGRYFAAAFFASTPKFPPVETDLDPGQFSMGDLINGDVNSFGPVVVPWQPLPQPFLAILGGGPPDYNKPVDVGLTWNPLRFIHDGSIRPCLLFDGVTPCPSVLGGVGVLDQGALIHHEIEWQPVIDPNYPPDPNNPSGYCSGPWRSAAGTRVDWPATITRSGLSGDVTWGSCLRLKTTFGRIPSQIVRTSPATTAVRDENRLDAQTGKLGDLGYTFYSRTWILGDPLVSQKATLESVRRRKGASLRVVFETDAELNITSFDLVGIDAKGGRKLIGTIACRQCVTGLGAAYDVILASAKLQGAKQVQIVIQPSGDASNSLDLK